MASSRRFDFCLCLFRVAQEALYNAVKYSGANHFSVDLRAAANNIRLEFRNAGAGFDLEKAKRNGGLGLVSMQERVHMVGGTFSIQSNANPGTRIVANVPLARGMKE
jgi:signal transduction histidine kinase